MIPISKPIYCLRLTHSWASTLISCAAQYQWSFKMHITDFHCHCWANTSGPNSIERILDFTRINERDKPLKVQIWINFSIVGHDKQELHCFPGSEEMIWDAWTNGPRNCYLKQPSVWESGQFLIPLILQKVNVHQIYPFPRTDIWKGTVPFCDLLIESFEIWLAITFSGDPNWPNAVVHTWETLASLAFATTSISLHKLGSPGRMVCVFPSSRQILSALLESFLADSRIALLDVVLSLVLLSLANVINGIDGR